MGRRCQAVNVYMCLAVELSAGLDTHAVNTKVFAFSTMLHSQASIPRLCHLGPGGSKLAHGSVHHPLRLSTVQGSET